MAHVRCTPIVRLDFAQRQVEAQRFRTTDLVMVHVKRYMDDGSTQFGVVYDPRASVYDVVRTDDVSELLPYPSLSAMLEDGWMGD